MRLTEILEPDCIKVPLEATEKQAAIHELVELLHAQGRISNADEVKEAVWQRESTRTTGSGMVLRYPTANARMSRA